MSGPGSARSDSSQDVTLQNSIEALNSYFKARDTGFQNGKKFLVLQGDTLRCCSWWQTTKGWLTGQGVYLRDIAKFCDDKHIVHEKLGSLLGAYNRRYSARTHKHIDANRVEKLQDVGAIFAALKNNKPKELNKVLTKTKQDVNELMVFREAISTPLFETLINAMSENSQFIKPVARLVGKVDQPSDKKIIAKVKALFQTAIDDKNSYFASKIIRALPKTVGKEILQAIFIEALDNKNYPQVIKLIQRFTHDELEGLLEKVNLHLPEIVQALKDSPDPKLQNIEKRFQQIVQVSKSNAFETSEMHPVKVLRMAIHIEEVVRVAEQGGILKKRVTGLSRTLQYDKASGMVYILADKRISRLTGEGSFKKVVSAAGLALNNYQKVEMAARVFTKVETSEADHLDAIKEAQIARLFNGKPGFMKVRTFCDYTFRVRGVDVPRVSVLYEASNGDLKNVSENENLLTFDEKLQVAKDVIYGLYAMHREGYMHGDVKPANALFMKKDPITKRARGGIADFGSARKEKVGQVGNNAIYKRGIYISSAFTAPELLGVKNFSGDHFKVDAFALGMMLCIVRHSCGEYGPPWLERTMNAAWHVSQIQDVGSQEGRAELNRRRTFIEKQLQDNVEKEVVRLSAKWVKSTQDKYDLLMYQLMRPNPATRFDLARAKQEIDRILPPPY